MNHYIFRRLPLPADLWPKEKPGRPPPPAGMRWAPAHLVVKEGARSQFMRHVGHVLEKSDEEDCTTPDHEGRLGAGEDGVESLARPGRPAKEYLPGTTPKVRA